MNEEYYDRIEAIQFTMNHDDGNLINEVHQSDIILVGVSRTSKTPTSIYLANKGFKTTNIPIKPNNIANHLLIPISSFKNNLASIDIKRGVEKYKAVATASDM